MLRGMSVQEKAAFFEKRLVVSQKELAYALIAESYHPQHNLDGILPTQFDFLVDMTILCHHAIRDSSQLKPWTWDEIDKALDRTVDKMILDLYSGVL